MTQNNMIKPLKKKLAVAVASLCTVAAFSNVSVADDFDFTLEEIIVTATKRAASTQDIPMSIEAVSGEKLVKNGIETFEELSASIPNFSVADGMSSSLIVMRGMGSGEDRSFEQSVSMFQDGIYMPRARQTRTPFFDADRVEVLKGPQAVLFGLNSTAGAIAVHSATNQPGDEFEVKLTQEYETEYEGTKTAVVIGGGVGDKLGVRLAIQHSDSGDGWINNTSTGENNQESRTDLARLSVVWEPTENLSLTLKHDYADYEVDGWANELINDPFGLAAAGFDAKLDGKRSADGVLLGELCKFGKCDKEGAEQEVNNTSLNVEWALGEHTITALYGHTDYTYDMAVDVDATNEAFAFGGALSLESNTIDDYVQDSLELRWASPTGGFVETVAGLYYQESRLKMDNAGVTGVPGVSVIARGNYLAEQEAEMFSAFASATFNLNETMRIIAGVRSSDVDKTFDRQQLSCEFDGFALSGFTDPTLAGTYIAVDNSTGAFSAASAGGCASAALGEDKFKSTNVMPELMFQMDITEDMMFFARWGESAKAGGFSHSTAVVNNAAQFDDETVEAIEAGLKMSLLDGRAELNMTVFSNEFTDLQLKSSSIVNNLVVTNIGNAGKSTSEGLEIDGRFAATDWLTVGGSVSWLESEFDDFVGAPCGQDMTNKTVNTGPLGGCDFKGMNLPFASDVAANFYADVDFELTESLRLEAGINVSYQDEYFTEGTLNSQLKQDAYTMVGARIGVASIDDVWSVSLVGKNLTNEDDIITNSQPLSVYDAVYVKPPRMLVLQGTYRFGN